MRPGVPVTSLCPEFEKWPVQFHVDTPVVKQMALLMGHQKVARKVLPKLLAHMYPESKSYSQTAFDDDKFPLDMGRAYEGPSSWLYHELLLVLGYLLQRAAKVPRGGQCSLDTCWYEMGIIPGIPPDPSPKEAKAGGNASHDMNPTCCAS